MPRRKDSDHARTGSPGRPTNATLLAYLAQQRDVIRITAYGLTDDEARGSRRRAEPVERRRAHQARRRPSSGDGSTWCCSATRPRPGRLRGELPAPARRDARRRVRPLRRGRAGDRRRSSRRSPTSASAVPVRKGVPWYPDDVDAWSVRWVLLHLIAETRAPRRPRRHRPRVDRRRDRVPAHGRGRRLAGDRVDAAVGGARRA